MSVEIVENLINSWAQTFGTGTKKSHNKSCDGASPGCLKEKLHLILSGFLKEMEKLPLSTAEFFLQGPWGLSCVSCLATWIFPGKATAGLLWEATSIPL